jgi:hypothetical protein
MNKKDRRQLAMTAEKIGGGSSANGLNENLRTIVNNVIFTDRCADLNYALQQFYFLSHRPHEADESFQKIASALPSIAEQTIKIKKSSHVNTSKSLFPSKIIALLHFGRSGTGLLHSLIDSHPEISTLPSIYLRGYFNEGVWEKISVNGWRGLPKLFADEFSVLFDARTSKPIPSRTGEKSTSVGENEGMTSVGKKRDEYLSLNRELFCSTAMNLIEGMESIDPMSYLMVIHAEFEEVIGLTRKSDSEKRLCFYHIHNPDDFAMSNFLRYSSDAQLLMTVREPIQNCESSLREGVLENDYEKCATRILGMLFGIDKIPFRMRNSVGVRLEDLKTNPKSTLEALCNWMGVDNSPTLYEMTAQGKKWWGDPSSPYYSNEKEMSPFDGTILNRYVGSILSKQDQLILQTLFYPFNIRFGYQDPDKKKFQKNLGAIRPFLDKMMDFEKTLADRSNIDHTQFKKNVIYKFLRAGLIERWNVLDELGEYPHMLEPLQIK